MTQHGSFHWNELVTPKAERAKQFYEKTIGWSFEPMPPTDRPGCEGVPGGWMSYLAVDDVDARTEKAVAAGATLMRPIFDVPNVGRIAILTEPGGAGVGWMTPEDSAETCNQASEQGMKV